MLEVDHAEYAKKAQLSKTQFSVGFEGDFGHHLVTPRTLDSRNTYLMYVHIHISCGYVLCSWMFYVALEGEVGHRPVASSTLN